MSISLTHLFSSVQKDEQWLVAEAAKAWAALESGAKTVETDLLGMFSWISAHQTTIDATLKTVLADANVVASLIPGAQPDVAAATAAIDVATAAIDSLSKGIQGGTTPLSTVVGTYHAVKDAQTAVNVVLKKASAKPAPKKS